MNSVLQDELNNRQADLDLIIDLTKFLSKQVGTSIEAGNEELLINDELINILKSVIHLMNYNQVESTLTSGIELLYDRFADNCVGYSQLRAPIQKKILSTVHKNSENIYNAVTNDINLNIPKASLKIKKLFNGNITKDTFSEMRRDYGIRVQGGRYGGNAEDLEILRDTRNDLAHGNKSFSSHGRGDSLAEFLRISNNTSLFMASTVITFDDYINNDKYLAE